MAEESKSGSTAFEDLALTLFALLLVGQIFQKGPEFIAERWGIELGGNQFLVAGAGLSTDTPLGSKVNATDGATYYDSPGGTGTEDGTFPPGSSLTLVDGPETVDGKRWWKVEDQITGKTGWVEESDLVREGVGGLGPGTKVGAKARALFDAGIWNAPGGAVKTGVLKRGELGELTKGPNITNGSRWWFFESSDTENSGWITEAALVLASDTGWEEGTAVVGKKTADIYERAGGGEIAGLLKEDEKGKILGGPVSVGGEMWWFIESEDSEEGWVREVDLVEGGVRGVFKTVVIVLMITGTVVTLILLGGIVYITIRTNQIRAKERERIRNAIPKDIEPLRNERWEKILQHANSDNPSDWRLAIIEADILLDEVVARMGYQGETLGERLKTVVRGDMETLDNAWEAHKVRNQIAHTGSDFILTQREARRVIDLYASVFNEFKVI